MHYSIEPILVKYYRKLVKGYGFLCFAKHMSKIKSKDLSGKYSLLNKKLQMQLKPFQKPTGDLIKFLIKLQKSQQYYHSMVRRQLKMNQEI